MVMRRKAQYRCAISKRVCPFNDDFWEMGGADSAAADGCPIGKYEDNHHKEGKMFVFDDWCKHLRERKDERLSDTEYISKDAFIAQQRKQYCENCERRKGTKNGKRIFVYAIGEAPCRACDIEDMIDSVWDFPPADAAPVVHGHWIYDYACNEEWYICSNCKRETRIPNYKFCPRCGAKMDESEV